MKLDTISGERVKIDAPAIRQCAERTNGHRRKRAGDDLSLAKAVP